jgi:dihydroorotate dehydrogenase
LSTRALKVARTASGGKLTLIGAGGVSNGAQAYAKIRAGASLVQLYSAMIYHGPHVARRIADGLERKLEEAGFSSIAEAIGTE